MTAADHGTDHAAARSIPLDAIPVIDVAPLLCGEDPEPVARALILAATEVGFFYVRNHGLPEPVVSGAVTAMHTFFDLPQKAKATVPVDRTQRGWMASGMATLDGAKTHDLKEIFFWGPDWAVDDPDVVAGVPMMAPNQWPEGVMPDLRPAILAYHEAVSALGRHLLSAIAMGLGLEAAFFERHYIKPLGRGQLVYYPPSEGNDEAESRFGAAPHTDFGALTLLLQDMNGGLQVRNRDGEWVAATPIPGTIVCNIGDLLQRWSNDRLQSTLHRVINRSGRRRHSIAFFFDPDSRAMIDPRDMAPSEEPRHVPVTAGEHILGRNARAFAQFKD